MGRLSPAETPLFPAGSPAGPLQPRLLANHYFLVAASLLLDLDSGATQVTGAVTRNTLAAVPVVSIEKNLTTAADGSVTGTVATESRRNFTIAGYVDTSHGRVETTVRQNLSFSNDQDFVVAETEFVQNIAQRTKITSGTETKGDHGVIHREQHFSWPLDLDISLVLNDDGSIDQTTSSDQTFESRQVQSDQGNPNQSAVLNNVKTTDTLLFSPAGAVVGFRDRASSQTYRSRTSNGDCYSRTITSADGILTSITDGQGCGNGGH